MDNYRDRMDSRYDRQDRDRDRYDREPDRDRDRYDDRYDRDRDRYDDRYDRGRRGGSYESNDSANVAEVIDRSNRDQLKEIAGYFDDAKDDIRESEKAIVRAVGENSDMLSDIVRSIKTLQSAPAAPVEKEEYFDQPSVEPSARNEILKAVSDNKSLLTLIRQDMITMAQRQAEDSEKAPVVAPAAPVEMPEFLLAERAEQLYKDMEEYVHMENVKCYRNMQAALNEQNANSDNGDKSLGGIKVISILSLVFTIITMILLVLFIFGII